MAMLRAALYCRLSKDDMLQGDSESIKTQKAMLTQYAKEHGFLVVEIYVDDGYSGLNFDRPSFNRMLDEIEAGKIDVVITKDLSRLGRDHLKVGHFTEVKKPEHALKLFVRFAIAKGAITYGMELMLALFNIIQGTISTIMGSAGFSTPQQTVLPPELITSVEECGFFESIPLWAVTLIGGLFITVMSFILIMTVYGRFFKLYMYTALAPIPLSTFAGEPSQNVGKSFIKSYCAVCLEGAVIVLSCIIFSLFASSPPVVNPDAAAVTQVWSYIGELLFNMLVLVGSVKMSDRIIREMMGL